MRKPLTNNIIIYSLLLTSLGLNAYVLFNKPAPLQEIKYITNTQQVYPKEYITNEIVRPVTIKEEITVFKSVKVVYRTRNKYIIKARKGDNKNEW